MGKKEYEAAGWTAGRKYDCGDIVEHNNRYDFLLRVSGLLLDEHRLFVTDDSGRLGNMQEFEIPFDEVTRHWKEVRDGE